MSRNDTSYALLSEYMLGTLEPAEQAEVEALLERSEAARAELRRLHATFIGLIEALPPVTPPAHVWEGLQARLEETSRTPVADIPRPEVPALPSQASGTPHLSRHYFGWALAACLALIAVGEGLWLTTSRGRFREVEREVVMVADFLAAPAVEKVSLYGRSRERIGTVLKREDGEALFVLGGSPASGRVYQAWGHASDDWTPGSDDRLTSLGVSEDGIFQVQVRQFAALYLSLEPPGGSPQPTYPLSRVSLTESAVNTPLSITAPVDGRVVARSSVIVTGTVDGTVDRLSYVLNGEASEIPLTGTRFAFTATLERGVNTLTVRAHNAQGLSEETLSLTRR